MDSDVEVAIVGAGPAGARAGELLAGLGANVALFDPTAPWEKPCGGGLTPPLLDEMPELAELKGAAQIIDRVRIELSPRSGFTTPLDRPIWVVSRRALSAWQLARAEAAGARQVRAKVRGIRRLAGGWQLTTDGGEFRARFLVGADGAASLVRRVAAPSMNIELAPTRVAYPRSAGPTPDTIVLQFYESLAGYLWDFPRPDHRSVGVGVPGGTWQRQKLDSEIDAYRDSSQPCRCSAPARGGAVIGTAQLGHGDYSGIVGHDYALLGDAAGFADPLTGEGIQNALRSAGLFVAAWASGDVMCYAQRARRSFEREFAIARVLRRFVFETNAATRLIAAGSTSIVSRAAVAALMNAINEHDMRPLSLLRRWFRACTQAPRTSRSNAIEAERRPVPCGCGKCDVALKSPQPAPQLEVALS